MQFKNQQKLTAVELLAKQQQQQQQQQRALPKNLSK